MWSVANLAFLLLFVIVVLLIIWLLQRWLKIPPVSVPVPAPVAEAPTGQSCPIPSINQNLARESWARGACAVTHDVPPVPLTPVNRDQKNIYECRVFNSKSSIGETAVRVYLEKRFGKPFPTCRPDFLKNPETGRNLELDCYNEEILLAAEYQGEQHYVYEIDPQAPNRENFFHPTADSLINQVRRDRFKVTMCNYVGVFLIRVPYWVDVKYIPSYIDERLPKWLKDKYPPPT